MTKVYAVSLGCDKNRVDTETMLGLLVREGYQLTLDAREADVFLVNTCGFIESAKKEAVDVILEGARLKDDHPGMSLVVAGCLVQRYARELQAEIPEIDALVGTGQVESVVAAVDQARRGMTTLAVDGPGYVPRRPVPRILTTPPYSAYLKIAEGCSNRCSYCVIPQLRGGYRSRSPGDVFDEARELVERGVRELVLVAQDTTRYGVDLGKGYSLASLLQTLAAVPGVGWIRLLYCYPTGITEELIETIANESRICKYLDIPMQHASNRILRAMGRPTTRRDLSELIKTIRDRIPGITLRSTFMVGFPGETEQDFAELLSFLKAERFERAGFFAYSAEEGTRAATMPFQVPEQVKSGRLNRAFSLQETIMRNRNREKIGRELTVLVEGRRGPFHWGRSEGDAPEIDGKVYFGGPRWAEPGEFVHVRIDRTLKYDVAGRSVRTVPV